MVTMLVVTPVPARHIVFMPASNVSNTLTLALRLPMSAPMRFILIPALAACTLLGQSFTPDKEAASDLNVNSRYTIESINFVDQREYKLSTSALEEIRRLVGAKVSTEALDRLVTRIRGELRAHDVTFKLTRGAEPESAVYARSSDRGACSFDASVPPSATIRRQTFRSGQLTSTIGPNAFYLSMLRDSDNLIERFSGVQAKYERLVGSRIRFGFEFDAYQDQYGSSTLAALDSASRPSSLGAGAYGSRLNYEPRATFVLAAPLTLTAFANEHHWPRDRKRPTL